MKTRLFAIPIALACLTFTACDDGPLEEAGSEIDDAADDAGDSIEDAVDDATD